MSNRASSRERVSANEPAVGRRYSNFALTLEKRRCPCWGSKPYAELRETSPDEEEDSGTHVISMPGTKGVRISIGTSGGQRVFEWLDEITINGSMVVPAGSTNLYRFPAWQPVDAPEPKRLSGAQLKAVMDLIVASFVDEACPFMDIADGFGAYPIHGILVGNTVESLTLGTAVMRARPEVLLQAHTASGAGVFEGENSLHVCIVNGHEALLMEIVRIACARLTIPQLRQVFGAQARGAFFNDLPMLHYGGTPLGYAACFGMKSAIEAMLSSPKLSGILSLNDASQGCINTGFRPLHAVAANGLRDMYDYLTTGIDAQHRANPKAFTTRGRQLGLAGLTPLQLAAKLGDHRMFKHIMRRQTKVLWQWGPLTQYLIDLDGVDSAGEQKGEDVMELVGDVAARKETQELILDSCMNGFVYELFDLKWKRFGSKLHWCLLSLDLLYVAVLFVLVFNLKQEPEHIHDPAFHPAVPLSWPTMVLLATGLCLAPELLMVPLWWCHHDATKFEGPGARWRLLKELGAWLREFHFHLKGASIVMTAAAWWLLPTPGAASRRMLRAGAAGGDEMSFSLPSDAGGLAVDDEDSWLWLLLALSLFWEMSFIMNTLLMPFRSLGVFMLTVNRMLREDILTFLGLFSLILLAFYSMLYTVYPRAGADVLPQAGDFNSWSTALEALVKLAVLGEPLEVAMVADGMESLSFRQRVNFGVFVAFYAFFVLVGMVLLLNLLIAMLSNTFAAVQLQAEQEWRLERARRVLRLELLAIPPLFPATYTRIGDQQGGRYYFPFRVAQANQEGVAVTVGSDFFGDDLADDSARDGRAKNFVPLPPSKADLLTYEETRKAVDDSLAASGAKQESARGKQAVATTLPTTAPLPPPGGAAPSPSKPDAAAAATPPAVSERAAGAPNPFFAPGAKKGSGGKARTERKPSPKRPTAPARGASPRRGPST